MASVRTMRRAVAIVVAAGLCALPSAALAAPDDSSTSSSSSSSSSTSSTSTTSSTTTTTLPSAVTTVPEGCALPPVAQAVFVGRLASRDTVSGTFEVLQVRAGNLDAYQSGTTTVVRYGGDVKFLTVGSTYLVGVALDPVTLVLASSVRDAASLFGGAEVAGSNVKCPQFEAAARTLNMDGTSVDTGVFVSLFSQPWRLVLAFVVPPILALMLLVGLVWLRRGTRR